jgi:hypothetical protein
MVRSQTETQTIFVVEGLDSLLTLVEITTHKVLVSAFATLSIGQVILFTKWNGFQFLTLARLIVITLNALHTPKRIHVSDTFRDHGLRICDAVPRQINMVAVFALVTFIEFIQLQTVLNWESEARTCSGSCIETLVLAFHESQVVSELGTHLHLVQETQ